MGATIRYTVSLGMKNDTNKTDWTGVAPDDSPIAPLTPETFVERLNRLSDRVNALRAMRQAMPPQRSEDGHKLPGSA